MRHVVVFYIHSGIISNSSTRISPPISFGSSMRGLGMMMEIVELKGSACMPVVFFIGVMVVGMAGIVGVGVRDMGQPE